MCLPMHSRRAVRLCLAVAFLLVAAVSVQAQDREAKVRADRARLAQDETWIYNDLDEGLEQARQSDKPLLVVLRCIPCEACSQFDKRLLDKENEVRDLFNRFVCVRLVSANGLDLSLFQFDYDQSFHVFLLAPDKTIYGRFGTRSDRQEEQDMTMAGLRAAMLGALELHKSRQDFAGVLAKKRGPKPLVATPEDFPSLQGKYGPRLNYEGNVVQSCIHCHQIREAERLALREAKSGITDQALFPYPLPEVIGLRMNPDDKASVAEVEPDSIAAKAGFEAGDQIVSLDGQPLLSTADLQWVLHHAKDTQSVRAVVERDGKQRDLTLQLPPGWRQASNISWRATTWDLRRIASGGLVLESSEDASEKPALRVKYIGEWGEHAAGKHAGFQVGDQIVSVDGKPTPATEGTYMREILKKSRGATTALSVLRDGKALELKLPVQ